MAKKKPPRSSNVPPPREAADVVPVGPLPLVKGRLQRVSFSGEIWEADLRQPLGGFENPEDRTPWILLFGSESTSLIRACEVSPEKPSSDQVWDHFAKAIQEPLAGTPGRPAQLLVGNDPLWETLRDHLTEIGVDLKTGADLGLLNLVFEDVVRELTGAMESDSTPLLEVPGMSVEKAASFFEASAYFFKEKPWKRLREEYAISITCPELGRGPWYGVIMGAAGVTAGLALYDDLNWLERVWTEQLSPEEQAQETEATALTYGSRDTMLPEDLAAMKEHGWKAGGREGYPEIYRKERGQGLRTPMSEEMAILDACLRAIPPFVKKRPSDDDTPEQVAVASPSGPLTLTLHWVTKLR